MTKQPPPSQPRQSLISPNITEHSVYQTGVNSIAHMTLAQIDLAPENPAKIYHELSHQLDHTYHLTLGAFKTSHRAPKAYFDYGILPNDLLISVLPTYYPRLLSQQDAATRKTTAPDTRATDRLFNHRQS